LPSRAVHSVWYWFFDNMLNTITNGRTLECRVEIIIQIFHLYSWICITLWRLRKSDDLQILRPRIMTQVVEVGCCSRTTRGRGREDIELSEKKNWCSQTIFQRDSRRCCKSSRNFTAQVTCHIDCCWTKHIITVLELSTKQSSFLSLICFIDLEIRARRR